MSDLTAFTFMIMLIAVSSCQSCNQLESIDTHLSKIEQQLNKAVTK